MKAGSSNARALTVEEWVVMTRRGCNVIGLYGDGRQVGDGGVQDSPTSHSRAKGRCLKNLGPAVLDTERVVSMTIAPGVACAHIPIGALFLVLLV